MSVRLAHGISAGSVFEFAPTISPFPTNKDKTSEGSLGGLQTEPKNDLGPANRFGEYPSSTRHRQHPSLCDER